jgi:hypothetical protein
MLPFPMFFYPEPRRASPADSPTNRVPLPRPFDSDRCHPACPERSRRERSEGSWLVRPLAPTAPFEQSLFCRHPFFLAVDCKLSTACPERSRRATLAAPPQLIENTTALNPSSANLDAASSLTPLFATLTKNTRGGGDLRHPSSPRPSNHPDSHPKGFPQ